ncbi:beta-mannosidase [Eupeodes corollae]|uniref:beta-mannosidase n=1 Tax=Eupeodes corollae TaxID=290404 RepID=UPI00249103BB|nr:beta-mannosidase [Eupeodes corollae]
MILRYTVILIVVLVECYRSASSESIREVELSSGWSIKNQNGSVTKGNLKLPSGIYSSLYAEDVLLSYNDVNMRWIAYDNWTYSRTFKVEKSDIENIQFVNLTFHGIDTISTIYLNGDVLGHTDNMFVRYTYNIRPQLKEENVLEVAILSPVWAAKKLADNLEAKNSTIPPNCPDARYHGECHMNMLRKMQASFSWDWGLAAPSMGIWKTVTLEYYEVALIRDIDVAVSRNNSHWTMDIRVFLETGIEKNFYGELIFYAVELLSSPVTVSYRNRTIKYTDPVIHFQQTIPVEDVALWWPNGYGEQKLYPLHFTMNAWLGKQGPKPRDRTISQKSVRIGFRTIELVQEELDDGNSFFFRVNGVPIFMKGTNYIPSHILPELSADQSRIKRLLSSAKEAHMNMIRVWGGGIYESDYFYDLADLNGILIWQDMMFACAMYPTHTSFLDSVRTEVIQNAKRLARHPSVAIFATNNENEVALAQDWYGTFMNRAQFEEDYRKLYVGTINHELRIIADSSRPDPLISSPSNGVKGIEDRFISKNPQDPKYGDVHFYDILKDSWDPDIYPRPRFASEYGFQSLPATGAWKRVLGKNDKIDELIDHRQHHPYGMFVINNMVLRHLPLPFDDPQMEGAIYLSQIAQAMSVKVETELYRSLRSTEYRTMGALYWQLNDVWVAPSWSSIDFYGNWKILHYWARDFLAPISVIALFDWRAKAINLTLVRDDITDTIMEVDVTMNLFLWSELYPKKSITWQAELKPNSDHLNKVIPLDQIFMDRFTQSNSFVEFLLSTDATVLSRTYHFPSKIKSAVGIMDPDLKVEISSKYCRTESTKNSYSLAIKIQRPALFVYIEIIHSSVTTYTLSKNGFLQLDPIQMVHLEFQSKKCIDLTLDNIKVTTVNQYML